MNYPITKPFRHLSRLFKIYSIFALLGILVALIVGLFSLSPSLGILVVIAGICFYWIRAFSQGRPPSLAVHILYYLLTPKDRDSVIDDFKKIYNAQYAVRRTKPKDVSAKIGADIWFWKEVIISIPFLIKWRIIHRLDLIRFGYVRHNIRDALPFYRGFKDIDS